MHHWMITASESTGSLAQGSDPDPAQAWRDAITAALDQSTTNAVDGCVVAMGAAPAWLMPQRTPDGKVDVPVTRASAERMARTAIGGLFEARRADARRRTPRGVIAQLGRPASKLGR